MIKVLLLIVLAHNTTGEVQFVHVEPTPSMAVCERLKSELSKEGAPQGSHAMFYCIEPGPKKVLVDG